jgi:hypothetical protein
MKKLYTFALMLLTTAAFAQPSTSAPTPSQNASEVTSVFSQQYNNIAGVNYNPSWGQATQFSWFTIGSDSILQYTGLNFQGIEYSAAAATDINGSTVKTVHFDIWTSNLTTIDIYVINRVPQEERSIRKTLTPNAWNSIDIDISEYSSQGMTVTSLYQFKFVDPNNSSATFYADNIYFYGAVAVTEPQKAAENPLVAAKNVTSIYSESYDDPSGINYYPNWGQGTQFTEFAIGEDSMLQYSNLDFQGIELGEDLDLSSMEFLHIDVWSSSLDTLAVYAISQSTGERNVKLGLNDAAWSSFDIPVSQFTDQGLSMTDIHQLKLEDLSRTGGTVFIDNIYFYTIPTPTMAAPQPQKAEEDVISLYSGAYTNVAVDTFLTSWSAGKLERVEIDGNEVLKYSDVDFVGIEFTGANSIDVTEMDTFRFDVWTPDASLYRANVVDFGADNAFGGGDDKNHNTEIAGAPTEQWVSHAIALSDMAGLETKANISQLIFSSIPVGASTLYIDNIYFSKEGSTGSVRNNTINAMRVYPNPASSYVTVKPNTTERIETISIVDLAGKTLIQDAINATVIEHTLDTKDLNPGVYFIQVQSETSQYSQKILVN